MRDISESLVKVSEVKSALRLRQTVSELPLELRAGFGGHLSEKRDQEELVWVPEIVDPEHLNGSLAVVSEVFSQISSRRQRPQDIAVVRQELYIHF